jgi:hypothetical protein
MLISKWKIFQLAEISQIGDLVIVRNVGQNMLKAKRRECDILVIP